MNEGALRAQRGIGEGGGMKCEAGAGMRDEPAARECGRSRAGACYIAILHCIYFLRKRGRV